MDEELGPMSEREFHMFDWMRDTLGDMKEKLDKLKSRLKKVDDWNQNAENIRVNLSNMQLYADEAVYAIDRRIRAGARLEKGEGDASAN